jgi:hypothetical protein
VLQFAATRLRLLAPPRPAGRAEPGRESPRPNGVAEFCDGYQSLVSSSGPLHRVGSSVKSGSAASPPERLAASISRCRVSNHRTKGSPRDVEVIAESRGAMQGNTQCQSLRLDASGITAAQQPVRRLSARRLACLGHPRCTRHDRYRRLMPPNVAARLTGAAGFAFRVTVMRPQSGAAFRQARDLITPWACRRQVPSPWPWSATRRRYPSSRS